MAETPKNESAQQAINGTGAKPAADQPTLVTDQPLATQPAVPVAETKVEGQPPSQMTTSSESRFLVIDATTAPNDSRDDDGYYEAESGDRISNFTAPLLVEEQVEDGSEIEKHLTISPGSLISPSLVFIVTRPCCQQ
jgi:hypothetical protein